MAYINLFMHISSEKGVPEEAVAQIDIDVHKMLCDEIERLRTLVHHAFCEGQITSPRLDDWKNSEVYAALKEGE